MEEKISGEKKSKEEGDKSTEREEQLVGMNLTRMWFIQLVKHLKRVMGL